DNHKRVDVVFGVGEVDGIDHQADVSGVFAAHAASGDLDQLNCSLVKRSGIHAEPAPVGIGLLCNNLTLLNQPFENFGDLEAVATVVEAKPHVLEVDEHGQRPFAVACAMWFHSSPASEKESSGRKSSGSESSSRKVESRKVVNHHIHCLRLYDFRLYD